MTIRQLVNKLLKYKDQDTDIDIGCDCSGGGYCLVTDDKQSIFVCQFPDQCERYIKDE